MQETCTDGVLLSFCLCRAIRRHRPRQAHHARLVEAEQLDDGMAFALGRVLGEDKVPSFDRLVAGEAGFKQRLIRRFAVFELSESPAARRGVFS